MVDHPDTLETELTAGSSENALLSDLVARGKLDQAGANRALAVARGGEERVSVVLSRLGLVSEAEIAETWSRLLSLPLSNSDELVSGTAFSDRISISFLQRAHAVPISTNDQSLHVAMADPSDSYTISALELLTGFKVQTSVGVLSEIDSVLQDRVDDAAEAITGDARPIEAYSEDVSRLRDIASEAPVVRYVSNLMETAVSKRASDIHLESRKSGIRVRMRIDGYLVELESPPPSMRAAIISRIKILAKLDIAEQRLPQDGRITETVRGEDIDFRVATTPSLFGERVVLRVLDRRRIPLNFVDLGFTDDMLAAYLPLLQQPHGILLVTGPTGSGKTTTLYASLAHLNKPDLNILTVEDPVEFEIGDITQVNVKPEIGLSFANVLRAFLRQDPDIMMVGEIRDLETAKIAVQASLTGHLVLATLHTNDSASAVTRLLEMGVEDYLLAPTLNGVVAQRLVRRLCQDCSEPYLPDPDIVASLAGPRQKLQNNFHKPIGCAACGMTGYIGRTSVLEILPVNSSFRELLMKGADHQSLVSHAISSGMQTLTTAGLELASRGITSLDEILRVTRE